MNHRLFLNTFLSCGISFRNLLTEGAGSSGFEQKEGQALGLNRARGYGWGAIDAELTSLRRRK